MNNPIVITGVTGAIAGAAAKELAKRGQNDLIIIGRGEARLKNIKDELKSINPNIAIDIVIADLNSVKSVRKAVETIKSKTNSLSGILNIAGVFRSERTMSPDGFETMFATNQLAPFQITTGLLELLKRNPGSKVVTVSAPSSTQLNFDDLHGEKKFSALNKFGASKMANLLFAFALARKIDGSGVASIAFHPGLVKSDLIKEMSPLLRGVITLLSGSPDKAGQRLAKILTTPEYIDANGKFLDKNGKELKKPGYSGNQEIQEKLWELSLKMIQ